MLNEKQENASSLNKKNEKVLIFEKIYKVDGELKFLFINLFSLKQKEMS